MSRSKKISNWKKYDESLKRRGQIVFDLSEARLEDFYYQEPQVHGGKRIYSPLMYEILATIHILLNQPWRATVGFLEKLLKNRFPEAEIHIPDYSHARREAEKLNLQIKPFLKKSRERCTNSGQSGANAEDGIVLVVDSTGLNVYSTSGHHQRKHGKSNNCRRHEQWKKAHIALDLVSGQVMAVELTDSSVNDCEVIEKMCQSIPGKIESICGDGAYDTHAIYKIADERGAKVIIPPNCRAKAQDELKDEKEKYKKYLAQRDQAINYIRQRATFAEGLKEWKIESGYHKRSRIESFMCRLKTIFGFSLRHKTDRARLNELIIKINLLNLMQSFGSAEYHPA